VKQVMEEELQKRNHFQAYEVVEDEGQERIDGRWIINRKEEHDGLKVKLKEVSKKIQSQDLTVQPLTDFLLNFCMLLQAMKAGNWNQLMSLQPFCKDLNLIGMFLLSHQKKQRWMVICGE
jgi:hypothetical protein